MADLRWYFMIERVEQAIREGDPDAVRHFLDYLRDYENPFSVHIRQWLIRILSGQEDFRFDVVRRQGRPATGSDNLARDQAIHDRVEELTRAVVDWAFCRKLALALSWTPPKPKTERNWNARTGVLKKYDTFICVGPFRWEKGHKLLRTEAYKITALQFRLAVPTVKKIYLAIAKAGA